MYFIVNLPLAKRFVDRSKIIEFSLLGSELIVRFVDFLTSMEWQPFYLLRHDCCSMAGLGECRNTFDCHVKRLAFSFIKKPLDEGVIGFYN